MTSTTMQQELARQLARYAEAAAADPAFAAYCTDVETALVATGYTVKEATSSVAGSIGKVRRLFDVGTFASAAAGACRVDDDAICF